MIGLGFATRIHHHGGRLLASMLLWHYRGQCNLLQLIDCELIYLVSSLKVNFPSVTENSHLCRILVRLLLRLLVRVLLRLLENTSVFCSEGH